MKANKVKPDHITNSLLFKKNVRTEDIEQANIYLAKVVGQAAPVFIESSDLCTFFEQSLERDNFEGLSSLIAYLERQDVNISSWKIGKFRSALDFYLNQSFDLNKVLTFIRFYTHYARGAMINTEELSEEEVFQRAFG